MMNLHILRDMINIFKYSIAFIKTIFFVLEDLLVWLWSVAKYVILIGIIILTFFTANYFNNNSVDNNYRLLRITKGFTFSQLTNQLETNNFIKSALLFKVASRLAEYDKRVRSGEFEVPSGLNEFQLVNHLLEAKPVLRKVTIIEGLKFSQIAGILSNSLELDSLKFETLFTTHQTLNEIKSGNLEGYLLPQTYSFEWGIDEKEVLDYLVEQNQILLSRFNSNAINGHLSNHELITLASIVQAECTLVEEMPIVASLYSNRLNRNMKLQADPTVHFAFYLEGKPKPARVLYRHLEIESPYNTYQNTGLPPGPINNPGKAALLAAMNPAKTDFLYMVTDGTNSGRHLFGRTLAEHNKNRKGLERARKKVYGN